jgi:hypothetical protein
MALIKAKSSSPVETGEDFSPLCLYEYHYKKISLISQVIKIFFLKTFFISYSKELGLNRKPNFPPVETGGSFSTLCLYEYHKKFQTTKCPLRKKGGVILVRYAC